MGHAIGLLSDARVALINPEAMRHLLDTQPRIARALSWATLVDEAISRDWLVNVARREPYERLAHLLCEMWMRMSTVGLVADDCFDLPLTQLQLGDTIGLTSVTVNRVPQRLRAKGLISLRDRQFTILDAARLKEVGGFNGNYFDRERSGSALVME
ncbi:Crp/Fnr family transcriptional regulator [Sphingomonas sp.]|uniref:Crp/Fnr family transcriptional regulator n=1 Tax=Sphingomonas sp. TaxID=28214 RepID=UPI003B002B9A